MESTDKNIVVFDLPASTVLILTEIPATSIPCVSRERSRRTGIRIAIGDRASLDPRSTTRAPWRRLYQVVGIHPDCRPVSAASN
jgi:hypothetical protein